MNILVIDIGGTHVKIAASNRDDRVEFASGPNMTAQEVAKGVRKLVTGWRYDRVSIGYPGPVVHGRIVREPYNLGPGWKEFDFARIFNCPVRIVNDAAMQALGSYDGGSMLFLGLGTGLGSALIVEGTLVAMELAHLPYKKHRTYEDYVGLAGLKRFGKKKWRRYVHDVVDRLKAAFQADYVVLGGGNARLLHKLPRDVRLGENTHAFRGGIRLWNPTVRARRSTQTA
jgi:predicted NBD/HSP70 family sugar kinase